MCVKKRRILWWKLVFTRRFWVIRALSLHLFRWLLTSLQKVHKIKFVDVYNDVVLADKNKNVLEGKLERW